MSNGKKSSPSRSVPIRKGKNSMQQVDMLVDNGLYMVPTEETSRSEVLSGVGQSVSEGLSCKTLWVPIKAIRLENRYLYSIIPYAPGTE